MIQISGTKLHLRVSPSTYCRGTVTVIAALRHIKQNRVIFILIWAWEINCDVMNGVTSFLNFDCPFKKFLLALMQCVGSITGRRAVSNYSGAAGECLALVPIQSLTGTQRALL